jgi:hypothetical protein
MNGEEFRAWLKAGSPVEGEGDELDVDDDASTKKGRQWKKLPKAFVREVLGALPEGVVEVMRNAGPSITLAGGFIRATLAGETPRDVDLFVNEHDKAQRLIQCFETEQKNVFRSDNAFTQKTPGVECPIQAVFRWSFVQPTELLNFFDFSIACAAIWHNGTRFTSVARIEFEGDVKAKTLRFMHPERPKGLDDLNASFARAHKFFGLGYEPPKVEGGGNS